MFKLLIIVLLLPFTLFIMILLLLLAIFYPFPLFLIFSNALNFIICTLCLDIWSFLATSSPVYPSKNKYLITFFSWIVQHLNNSSISTFFSNLSLLSFSSFIYKFSKLEKYNLSFSPFLIDSIIYCGTLYFSLSINLLILAST